MYQGFSICADSDQKVAQEFTTAIQPSQICFLGVVVPGSSNVHRSLPRGIWVISMTFMKTDSFAKGRNAI